MKLARTVTIWRNLHLSRQLLISVNSVLLIVVGFFLSIDYQRRISHAFEQKRIALTEESKTIYESVRAVERFGPEEIQKLIDNICAWMNSEESPGHHIAVDANGNIYQAKSHGQASSEMLFAMQLEAEEGKGLEQKKYPMIVGVFEREGIKVYVSESRSKVLAAAKEELVLQMVAMLMAGILAAGIVNFVLFHVISSPIGKIVNSLQAMSGGTLREINNEQSCKELSYLSEQMNSMIMSLNAIEKDRKIQMDKARKVQEHLLPNNNDLLGLKVAGLFEPAEEVGGDYMDVIPLSEKRYLLCMADVSGHGVPAAMAAAVLKSLVLETLNSFSTPASILTRINQRYSEMIMPGHFATMVVLVVDINNSCVTYANAGHEPPYLQKPDGIVSRLDQGELILGVDENMIYEDETVHVESRTKIVLVSDGVTETFDPDDNQFGSKRVTDILEGAPSESVDVVVNLVKNNLAEFRRSRPPFDDTTLVIAQIDAG